VQRPFVIKGVDQATGRIVETTLPAATKADAEAQARQRGLVDVTAAPAPDAAVTSDGASKETPLILLVDDHEDTRRVLVQMLRSEGYQAVAAADGPEALAFLKTTRPSLAILDFNMPGMSGLALFAEIREDGRLAGMPVIMFSSHGSGVRESALKAGVDAYIAKDSMDWATLHREILRLVGPGTLEKKLPDVPPARAKDAG
jgi:CheY-like chemotaxis protein